MKRRIGSIVVLNPENTEQYPEDLQGVNLVITHVSTKYMPAYDWEVMPYES